MAYSRRAGSRQSFDSLDRYFSDIAKFPLLTGSEERALTERVFVHSDDEACQQLILSNLRLVVKIALMYHSPYLSVFDLIQEGNIGLIRAVQKYNPEKGSRFATYAFLWIRAMILRHIMNLWGTVKIGANDNHRKAFYRLNKAKKELYKSGIEPNPAVIAQVLNIGEEAVRVMENRLTPDLPLDFARLYEHEDIEKVVVANERNEALQKTISRFKQKLDERSIFILENRIMADSPLTLEEIGRRYSISRQRVQQLEATLRKRLKASILQGVWERRVSTKKHR